MSMVDQAHSPAPSVGEVAATVTTPPTTPVAARSVGVPTVIVMLAYLVALMLLVLYSLVQLWPETSPAVGATAGRFEVAFLVWTLSITDEVRLLLLVAIAGALGGLVHALRSFYWYVGNRQLLNHWIPMYILLPFLGTALALLFYLVIRGGFFSTSATVQQTSPFGFVALAGLIGMFSPQAVLKLKQVAETILAKPEPGANARPQEVVGAAETGQPVARPPVETNGTGSGERRTMTN